LAASIRALARSFEKDSGMRIVVDVEGSTRRLSARVEQALYRVTHEALANAWRHGRGANVRVCLATGTDEVSLTVVDDGVGFKFSEEEPRIGIASMRRAIDEVGGSLRIRNVKPHGVRVEARVSKEGR
jgi:signal transduction histidine kinase